MIKTEEATLFSGFEAIALAPGGAGIRIFLGQPKPLGFRPAPLLRESSVNCQDVRAGLHEAT